MGPANHAIRMSAPSAGASAAGSPSKTPAGSPGWPSGERPADRGHPGARSDGVPGGCARPTGLVGAHDGHGASCFDSSGATESDTDMSVQGYYSLGIDD